MREAITDLSNKDILVAPSILAADFANLGEDIKRIVDAGADIIHLDVMDGHFVPNISFGVPIIKSIREVTKLPFDVHLMISNPLDYIDSFAKSGADGITFHIESNGDPKDIIAKIKENGCAVGVSLKPKTPVEAILPYLEFVDLVLVMTVEPGFGGQSFMSEMMEKVTTIREEIEKLKLNIHLELDGGIDETTVNIAKDAGANMLVAGTAVFKHPEGAKIAIERLK